MFQFTHPGRGATGCRYKSISCVRVSIHAPREGCDTIAKTRLRRAKRFNSRTPGGVRQYVSAKVEAICNVSIHAPREGCDSPASSLGCCCCSFNSRTPGGVRPLTIIIITVMAQFQFTHPGRGATRAWEPCKERIEVSIHAPREGCDSQQKGRAKRANSFNSRTPGGVRLRLLGCYAWAMMFQFTHPGRGATDAVREDTPFIGSFNSRTPGGVRLGSSVALGHQ